jgi:uncharacterized protein
MSNLVNKIKTDSIEAMRNGEKEKLSTLRLLVAELEKEKISHKLTEVAGLSDSQAQAVISRQIKKLDKEIEAYVAVGRGTEAQEAEKELLITYLPKQLTEDEIKAEIAHAVDLVARGEIPNPMKYLGSKLKGRADMKQVQEIIKQMSN